MLAVLSCFAVLENKNSFWTLTKSVTDSKLIFCLIRFATHSSLENFDANNIKQSKYYVSSQWFNKTYCDYISVIKGWK